MSPAHLEPAESPEVVVRCQEDPGVVVRLCDRYFPDQYGVAFGITAQADGLNARIDGGELWIGDGDGDLAHFLDGLADEFRGWDGERSWTVNHLTLRAVFHSRGHVSLTWTLALDLARHLGSLHHHLARSREQMATLAADVRHFLLRPNQRSRVSRA